MKKIMVALAKLERQKYVRKKNLSCTSGKNSALPASSCEGKQHHNGIRLFNLYSRDNVLFTHHLITMHTELVNSYMGY